MGKSKVMYQMSANAELAAVARGKTLRARLVLANKLESMAEHLARHRLADVFLDILPFNAHTTAVESSDGA